LSDLIVPFFPLLQWTSKGDAFIIGSDIKRLENTTLQQFFRHNRFQSLVRQLNFYSFRKVNKERNIWIYKHELFHRDCPEDLYKVRRRTCPGLDGRKQRFNRYSTRRLNGEGSDESSEESSVTDENAPNFVKKHFVDDLPLPTKRPRRLSNDSETISKIGTQAVDSSLVDVIHPDECKDTEDLVRISTDLLTVSEVSDRLEEYARKARGLSGSRGSRRSGVVTPPYEASSAGLVTYDDECNFDSDDQFLGARIPLRLSLTNVCDDGAAVNIDDSQFAEVTPPPKSKKSHTPPVKETSLAASMMKQIVERIPADRRHEFIALTVVARFCMSTSPSEDSDLCGRVLQVVATFDELSKDFQLYRAALDPCAHTTGMQRAWQHDATRQVAVRHFKTFAVNCIHTLLGSLFVSLDEKIALELTADLWSKSVGVGA
jgi:hypothetical protein